MLTQWYRGYRAYIASKKKSVVILIFILCLFLHMLLMYFSISGFKQFDYEVPCCRFSCFLCLGVPWHSGICGCITFITSEDFFSSHFFFYYFFCPSHFLSFGYFNHTYMWLLDVFPYFADALFIFFRLFLCVSFPKFPLLGL